MIAWFGIPAEASASPKISTNSFSFWHAFHSASVSPANSPGVASHEFQPATLVAMPRNCDGLPADL